MVEKGKKMMLAEKVYWSNISGAVKRDILVLKGGDLDHIEAAIKGQFSYVKVDYAITVYGNREFWPVFRIRNIRILLFSGFSFQDANKKSFFKNIFVFYLPYVHFYIYISPKDSSVEISVFLNFC